MRRGPDTAVMSRSAKSRPGVTRLVTALLGFLLCAVLPAWGESPADFSGTWRLDKDRSVFPDSVPAVLPGELTMIVEQHGDTLRIERRFHVFGMHRQFTFTYYLDGREATNRTPRGEKFISRSRWQGTSLVTESKGTRKGQAVEFIDINRLEEDGRIFVVESTLLRVNQDTPEESRMVFVRE